MKVLNNFKKIIALGMSFSMIGATLLGASAVSLEDYPKPFVINGIPSNNLVLIVGDNAAASDVVGMGDIISGLQASAITEKELPITQEKVTIEDDSSSLGTTSNLMEINETIGDVKDLFTEADLDILKGGVIPTGEGITKYNQYLKFNNSRSFNSSKVIFTQDNFLDHGDFLFFSNDDLLFDWELSFESGLASLVSNANSSVASLTDLNSRTINILGQEYTIVNTKIDTSFRRNNSLKIDLIGGGINGRLTGGQEETFFIGNKVYKVKAVLISSSGTLLNINGKELPPLKIGQTALTEEGLLVGMRNIIEDSFNIADFTLGGSKITFIDNDVTDNVFTSFGTRINGEIIDQSRVKIRGELNNKRNEFKLQSIKHRLFTEATGRGAYVPPGHGVREYLKEPEGMLSSGWDIKYKGLSDTGVTFIKLHQSGANDEYKLEFTNEEGLNYQIPAFTVQNSSMRTGQGSGTPQHQMLWTVEAPNTAMYPIAANDYFILSNLQSLQTPPRKTQTNSNLPARFGCAVPIRTTTRSSGANTRVLQYISRQRSTQENDFLTFRDLATGTKQVKVNSSQGLTFGDFTIVLGGKSYIGKVHNTAGNVSVDIDGNGTISRGASGFGGNGWMVTDGGAILFINTSTNFSANMPAAQSLGSPRVATGISSTNSLGNSSCLTITILANKFDEVQPSNSKLHHLNVSIPIVAKRTPNPAVRAGSRLGIDLANFRSSQSFSWGLTFNFTNLTTNPTIFRGIDLYGGIWEFHDPRDNVSSEEFTYEFPLSQRGPKISIGSEESEVDLLEEATASKSITSDKLNKLPIGISKLASEIKNIKQYAAVVIGGPCANQWASELMNKPEPCHESIPEGEALIRFYEHVNGNVALLVAGRDAIDTRRGARALQLNKIKEAGSVKSAKVTGLELDTIVVKAIQ